MRTIYDVTRDSTHKNKRWFKEMVARIKELEPAPQDALDEATGKGRR